MKYLLITFTRRGCMCVPFCVNAPKLCSVVPNKPNGLYWYYVFEKLHWKVLSVSVPMDFKVPKTSLFGTGSAFDSWLFLQSSLVYVREHLERWMWASTLYFHAF